MRAYRAAEAEPLLSSLSSLLTLDELHWVCPRAADGHAEMEVRFELAFDVRGIAYLTYDLAHGYFLPRFNAYVRVKIRVIADHSVPVIDRYRVSPERIILYFRHRSLHHRRDRCAERSGNICPDDCRMVELFGGQVHITPGDYRNIKMTTPDDLALAEGILKTFTDEKKP